MRERKWTIQVLPEDGERMHTLRLPGRALLGAGIAAVVLAGAAALQLFLTTSSVQEGAERQRLETENRHLTSNLRVVEDRISRLGRSLDDLSTREQRFRVAAGLPLVDPEIRAVGVGGPIPDAADRADFYRIAPRKANRTYELDADLGRLTRRADLLASSISEAADSALALREIFLARPSIRPVDTEDAWISSGFSHSRYHPILRYNRPHRAIDISARTGSPIRAAAHGTVRFAGERRGYGKTVEVEHGYGYRTLYSHAGEIGVRTGERVERGDVLGRVGESGLSTGPHVHYEVLVEDRPVDPRPYLLDDGLAE